MKSVGARFLVPFGFLAIIISVFVFYRTYELSQKHADQLISQQAAIALEFNLAIRDYAAERIRPAVAHMVERDAFIPELMSTSLISRGIFEEVRRKLPGFVIRFASDDPRNPANMANSNERRLIELFRQNPHLEGKTEEITIDGRRYLAQYTPKRMKPECLQCHGDPKDAPAELLKRYGQTASFHRKVGDVTGVDTVAVPLDGINASMASEMRSQFIILATGLTLLFGLIILVFRFVVTRRLTTITDHFNDIAVRADSSRMAPLQVTGDDEISAVAVAFNKLVEQLNATRTLLEMRVRERTEELQRAYEQLQLELAERKRSEAALAESEKRFSIFMDHLPTGVFIKDGANRLLFANRYLKELFGWDRSIGMTTEELLPPEIAERMVSDDQKALAEGLLVVQEQVIDVHGAERFFDTYKFPIAAEGAPVLLGGIAVDVTERRRAGEEKEKLEAQLTHAQKLESVGRLAGGVAHDFNNMLGVILGHCEMTLDRLSPGDALYQDIVEIQRAANRSAELTRQLLAFARKQTVRPKVLDLNDTISGMLKMLRRLIGEDIDLTWTPGHELWKVHIDPSQVDQILANLMVNSRDAISGTGAIALRTENITVDASDPSNPVEFQYGDYILLTVGDTGEGMDKDTLEHIFEPFFTTKEVGRGTGLGLATVYGIVKQNNGFIYVESKPGEGATFRIYLPRLDPVPGETAADRAVQQPQGGGEAILLVEDDESMLQLSKQMLDSLGYTVLASQSPTEAIRLLETYPSDVGMLLTDVVMPEMNGRELAEKARAIRPGLKSLFMSGYTADMIAHRGVLEEGVHFIHKPFRRNDLAVKIKEVLEME